MCVFQVSRHYLGFWPAPKHFIVLKKICIYIMKIYVYIRMKKNALWPQNILLDFVIAGPFFFFFSVYKVTIQ